MKKKSGFTFIEVALVLAIAGLIFAMAFVALPSLMASQRDADRKAKVMEFVSDVKTYQTNNSRGALPILSDDNGPEVFDFEEAISLPEIEPNNSWRAMVRDYVDRDFTEASGNPYKFYIVRCLASDGKTLATGSACAYGDSILEENGNKYNSFAKLNDPNDLNFETGADGVIYVAIGATCDGDHAIKTNGDRSIAAIQVLERAGRHCYNT